MLLWIVLQSEESQAVCACPCAALQGSTWSASALWESAEHMPASAKTLKAAVMLEHLAQD